ncbi:MAG: glutathione S-transferase family protein [Rhodospirillales bacterium]|nr:glutathione S-transferase family protein [Rhodospirillales bacterium]
MRTLYHLWLSPFCRKVRIALQEKKAEFDLKAENVWDRRPEFLAINPAGEVPVLIEPDGTAISGSQVICEYLEDTIPEPAMLGKTPLERAEVRRLVQWFDEKFNREVTENLVGEKVNKRFLKLGQPDSSAIRAGYTNIHHHLGYIAYLVDRRKWLAGDQFSLADIAAAAHLSCVDYIGDVPWNESPSAKDWYARIKSRPSFRPLLGDQIPGVPPPKHYADLDF